MIRNKVFFAAIFLCPLLIITPTHAAKSVEECQKKNTDKMSPSSMSRCLDGVISHVNRELQTWVNLHSFNLEEKALVNGRYSALNMFKRSQSNFITYRENDCRWQYLAVSPDRGADLAYKKCFVKLSNSRINALSDIESSSTP